MLAELVLTIVISTTSVPSEPYINEVDELEGFEIVKEVEKEEVRKKPKEEKGEYLGWFEITAYSYNEGYGENFETATGTTPEPYYTVAVDPEVIPLGSILYIEGIGKVQAQDTGGAVKGNIIDLHVGYDDCDSFGRQNREVYLIKE